MDELWGRDGRRVSDEAGGELGSCWVKGTTSGAQAELRGLKGGGESVSVVVESDCGGCDGVEETGAEGRSLWSRGADIFGVPERRAGEGS